MPEAHLIGRSARFASNLLSIRAKAASPSVSGPLAMPASQRWPSSSIAWRRRVRRCFHSRSASRITSLAEAYSPRRTRRSAPPRESSRRQGDAHLLDICQRQHLLLVNGRQASHHGQGDPPPQGTEGARGNSVPPDALPSPDFSPGVGASGS
jgi:hypothetical protein